jgi:hypothetical protein
MVLISVEQKKSGIWVGIFVLYGRVKKKRVNKRRGSLHFM